MNFMIFCPGYWFDRHTLETRHRPRGGQGGLWHTRMCRSWETERNWTCKKREGMFTVYIILFI